MSETRLSEQQLNYFNTFGYLYFPGLMADCIDRIIEEFEVVWGRARRRAPRQRARRPGALVHRTLPRPERIPEQLARRSAYPRHCRQHFGR